MISQCHAQYVPQQGTTVKAYSCPTGVLGTRQPSGHTGQVIENNISKIRKARGMTQEQLASAIGTSRNMLVKLEGGSRDLTSTWIERISEALDVEPFALIAPDNLVPSEEELAQLLAAAQQTLPAGLPFSEWPRAVAAGLHMRLRTLAGDRTNGRALDY